MENEEKKSIKRTVKLERICGIILLIPPILGAWVFSVNLIVNNTGKMVAEPIYLGLMAIAGAIMLKGTGQK